MLDVLLLLAADLANCFADRKHDYAASLESNSRNMDCRYEEEQELAQTARRFMKKREKERQKKDEKERLKAERERKKAEKKALKALQKATKDQLAAESPLLLSKDPQMAEGSRTDGGKSGNIGPGDDKRVNRAANNTETSGLVTYEEVTVLCMKFTTSSKFDIVD
ncbi:uncharacterized protein [Macrobrachium rosenbergii]|uniref:uncharacterized protein isoform X2 n=2 Tax=Macrobrachium rosenbergii TaxID=79674 RepID=UPI0034D7AB81